MPASVLFETVSPAALRTRTAEDLMTPNHMSLRDTLTVRDATAFLIRQGISGAPVIDEGGRPIGVLSQTDILIHNSVDNTLVRDLMTPAVFAVGPKAPVRRVVKEMCELNVHRLFVVDGNGILVGVISALDVLRHLNACEN